MPKDKTLSYHDRLEARAQRGVMTHQKEKALAILNDNSKDDDSKKAPAATRKSKQNNDKGDDK